MPKSKPPIDNIDMVRILWPTFPLRETKDAEIEASFW